jgi:excisionase family DNA binding protein
MNDNLPPIALTVNAAVRYSGIARTRLYQLMHSGDLESFTIGGRRMFRRDALDAFIDRASRKAA